MARACFHTFEGIRDSSSVSRSFSRRNVRTPLGAGKNVGWTFFFRKIVRARDLTCKNTIRPARSLATVAVWRRKAGRNWDCNWDCNIATVVDMSLTCRAARTPSSPDQAAVSAKMINWSSVWKLICRATFPQRRGNTKIILTVRKSP